MEGILSQMAKLGCEIDIKEGHIYYAYTKTKTPPPELYALVDQLKDHRMEIIYLLTVPTPEIVALH